MTQYGSVESFRNELSKPVSLEKFNEELKKERSLAWHNSYISIIEKIPGFVITIVIVAILAIIFAFFMIYLCVFQYGINLIFSLCRLKESFGIY